MSARASVAAQTAAPRGRRPPRLSASTTTGGSVASQQPLVRGTVARSALPLLLLQVQHITRASLRAYLTGYALTALAPIIRLLIQRALSLFRTRRKHAADSSKSQPSLVVLVARILVSSLRGRLPLFMILLIGGFTSFDVLFWHIARRHGYYPPPVPPKRVTATNAVSTAIVPATSRGTNVISSNGNNQRQGTPDATLAIVAETTNYKASGGSTQQSSSAPGSVSSSPNTSHVATTTVHDNEDDDSDHEAEPLDKHTDFDRKIDIYGPRTPSPHFAASVHGSFDDLFSSSSTSNSRGSPLHRVDSDNNGTLHQFTINAAAEKMASLDASARPLHPPPYPSTRKKRDSQQQQSSSPANGGIYFKQGASLLDDSSYNNDIEGFDHVILEDVRDRESELKRIKLERKFAIALTPPHPRTRKRVISPTFLAAVLSSGIAISVFDHNRRSEFALFSAVRALDSLASFQKRWVRQKLSFIPEVVQSNADAGLFIICCAEIMFSWFYHPEVLPKAYREWITYMSHTDPTLLLMIRYFHEKKVGYNMGVSKYDQALYHLADKVKVPRSVVEFSKVTKMVPCSVVHNENVSCSVFWCHVFVRNFIDAMKIYSPVHLLPLLIFRFRKLKTDPIGSLEHLAVSIIRSSAFLSFFVVIIFVWVCNVRSVMKTESTLGPLMGCLTCGFSIFCERKGRRREMALYVVPKALESRWSKMFGSLVIPGGATTLFSLSMGYLLSAYRHEPRAVRPAARGVIGFFLM